MKNVVGVIFVYKLPIYNIYMDGLHSYTIYTVYYIYIGTYDDELVRR